MKKFVILFLGINVVISAFLCRNTLYADVDCLDDTLHINEYCARRYGPLCCTCPCWRYKHAITDRNRCIQCLHFRDPKTRSF